MAVKNNADLTQNAYYTFNGYSYFFNGLGSYIGTNNNDSDCFDLNIDYAKISLITFEAGLFNGDGSEDPL